jgi:hypothetical protein
MYTQSLNYSKIKELFADYGKYYWASLKPSILSNAQLGISIRYRLPLLLMLMLLLLLLLLFCFVFLSEKEAS